MASSTAQSNLTSNPIPNSLPNPGSRKRPLDHAQSSPYFKIRLTLKDLRPLFLQVISAPESQHAEAALGIQEKMKLMVDLCKQMAMEVPSVVKCDGPGKKPSEEFVNLDKEDDLALGTSVVGGSAFGWNFVTYISSKAEYYGRTKESFRASKQKSEG